MEIPVLQKLIAAPFTPMLDDGEINYDVVEDYVQLLLKQDVRNVFVNGTTGEGVSLTISERKKLAEKWMEFGKGKLDNIIIHVGTACIKDSQELARHAQSIGADFIGCLPPFYFRPESIKLLVDCLEAIAKAAPSTPLLYYHIPSMTGVEFSMFHMMSEAVKRIPSFAGLKFTSFDLVELGRCVEKFGDKYNFCYGKDEQLVMGFMLGAKAGVGSTYNYGGKLYSGIYEAAMKGDFKSATVDQILSQKMVGIFFDEGFDMGTHKAIMQSITGLPVGPPRLPYEKATKEKVERIMKQLKGIGLLERLRK